MVECCNGYIVIRIQSLDRSPSIVRLRARATHADVSIALLLFIWFKLIYLFAFMYC